MFGLLSESSFYGCLVYPRKGGGRERMKFGSNAANVHLSVYVDVCAYGEPKRHFFYISSRRELFLHAYSLSGLV